METCVKLAYENFVDHGTCRFIWFWETKNKGALVPSTVTEVPARDVGRGVSTAASSVTARFVPKIDTIDPGEIGWAKDAALRTSPDRNWGGTCENAIGRIRDAHNSRLIVKNFCGEPVGNRRIGPLDLRELAFCG